MPNVNGQGHRLRDTLKGQKDITEKKVFGGLAFMSRGYMFVGIVGDVLMACVGPPAYESALTRPHVREMDFTGKPMKGYVYVDSQGFEEDNDLSAWDANVVNLCKRYH